MDIYAQFLKDDLKNTIKNILINISKNKINKFCIYISFEKDYDDVIFPELDDYDNDASYTIVLQNMFWNLTVDDDGFSVTLKFDDENIQVYIPFESITLFTDTFNNFLLDLRAFKLSESTLSIHNEDINNDKDSNLIYIDL
jgi:hypothetical protein